MSLNRVICAHLLYIYLKNILSKIMYLIYTKLFEKLHPSTIVECSFFQIFSHNKVRVGFFLAKLDYFNVIEVAPLNKLDEIMFLCFIDFLLYYLQQSAH